MPALSIEIENLSAGYGQTWVLDGVSLKVPAGQLVAVLGRNGMGKSTLLASLAGQTTVYGGQIRLDGADITKLPGAGRARMGLGYVPQARCIFSSLTVEENLIAGLKGRPVSEVELAYRMFPSLKERRKNSASKLSGGEQQMLSIARTILGRPSVLLLDEPLEGLAPIVCEELMQALGALAKTGEMTIFLVEQRIQAALDFAERVVILDRGTLAWDGAPSTLLENDRIIDRLLGLSQ